MSQKIQNVRKYAVIAAVILIPLLYSFFYLYAFWDPYAKLKDLPVAVVNQDHGSTINGQTRNVGKDILANLKADQSLKWLETTDQDAKDGLKNRKYYAEILIPENFSQQVASADKSEKVKGLLYYKPEEKRNFLAAQVLNRVMLELKGKISKDITKEIVSNMVLEVKKVPADLKKLDDGLTQLADGSSTLSSGMQDLKNGQTKFADGVSSLNKGLQDAGSGADKLQDASAALASGASQFYKKLSGGSGEIAALQKGSEQFANGMKQVGQGAGQMEKGLNDLKSGSSSLNTGLAQYSAKMGEFSQGLNTYADGVSSLTQSSKAVGDLLKSYLAAHPEAAQDASMKNLLALLDKSKTGITALDSASATMKASSGALAGAAKDLAAGSQKLDGGIGQFEKGAIALPQGVSQLSDAYVKINDGIQKTAENLVTAAKSANLLSSGAGQLNKGMITFGVGIGKAAEGGKALYDNSQKLSEGDGKIADGITQLNSGLKDAKSGISDAIAEANEKMSKLDGLDDYAAEPINMQQESVDPVPDYGTAFAPYFMSLSLWVGALIIFIVIYLDPKLKFKRMHKNSHGVVRFFSYALISLVQAVCLGVILEKGLDLQVKNNLLFYLVCMLISMCFVSIMQFLIVNLKDIGKFLALLLLILQLTSCGGTFPMELVPDFFKVIKPFMPMTYSVNALKEVISGIDHSFLNQNLLVLAVIAVVFLTLSFVVSKLTGKLDSSYDADEEEIKLSTAAENSI